VTIWGPKGSRLAEAYDVPHDRLYSVWMAPGVEKLSSWHLI